MAGQNRRKHQRVKPKLLTARLSAGNTLHVSLQVDSISMGGVFVKFNKALSVGMAVSLELSRSGASAVIPVTGTIVSSTSALVAAEQGSVAGIGIAFDPLPPHIVPRIEGIIAAVDPAALRPIAPPMRSPPVRPDSSTEQHPAFVPGQSESATLKHQVEALHVQLRAKDRELAQLRATIEQLRQKMLLHGVKG